MRYLHGSFVNQDPVELLQSLVCAVGFAENDSGNSPANAIWSIGDVSPPNRADGFAEVFLVKEGAPISPLVIFQS